MCVCAKRIPEAEAVRGLKCMPNISFPYTVFACLAQKSWIQWETSVMMKRRKVRCAVSRDYTVGVLRCVLCHRYCLFSSVSSWGKVCLGVPIFHTVWRAPYASNDIFERPIQFMFSLSFEWWQLLPPCGQLAEEDKEGANLCGTFFSLLPFFCFFILQ